MQDGPVVSIKCSHLLLTIAGGQCVRFQFIEHSLGSVCVMKSMSKETQRVEEPLLSRDFRAICSDAMPFGELFDLEHSMNISA